MPPLNMVGDFGGGGMFLAFGVVCALLEAQRSGQRAGRRRGDGRRVGCADEHVLGDARASVCSTSSSAAPTCSTPARTSTTCTNARTATYISIGSIEPQFYAELMRLTGLDGDAEFAKQMDKQQWPHLKQRLTEVFESKIARRMVRSDGGHRCVLRAGADDERGSRASAQRASGRPSSRSPGPCSPPRRRGSRAHLPRSSARRRTRASTPRRSSRDWGFDAARIDELIASKAVVAG